MIINNFRIIAIKNKKFYFVFTLYVYYGLFGGFVIRYFYFGI